MRGDVRRDVYNIRSCEQVWELHGLLLLLLVVTNCTAGHPHQLSKLSKGHVRHVSNGHGEHKTKTKASDVVKVSGDQFQMLYGVSHCDMCRRYSVYPIQCRYNTCIRSIAYKLFKSRLKTPLIMQDCTYSRPPYSGLPTGRRNCSAVSVSQPSSKI